MATPTEIFKATVKTSIEDKSSEASVSNSDIAARFYDAADLIVNNAAASSIALAGPATASTNPGTPSTPKYYTFSTAGTYTNFKDSTNASIVVNAGEAGNLVYNGTYWTKQVLPAVDLSPYVSNTNLNTKIKDVLTSTSPTEILSANMGRVLDGKLSAFAAYDYAYVQVGVSTVNTPSWQYEASTFSGWAVNVAAQPSFNSARIKIRSWDAANLISNVRMIIRDTNSAGAILADKTVAVTAPLATVVDVNFIFDAAVNTANPLWVEYMTDGRCGLYGVLGAPFTSGAYTVAKNLTTEPATPLGTASGALIIFNNATPSAKLLNSVADKAYTYMDATYGLAGASLAKQALVSSQKLSVEKTNSGAPGGWLNESSTFRGWGNLVGSPQNFNGVQFRFRFWSSGNPVTQIRVVVKDTSYTGTTLADVTIPYVGVVNVEQTVVATFTNIVNASGNPIWVEYHADGFCGRVTSSLYGNSSRYTINASITTDFSASSNDDSGDSGVYFQAGTFVAVTQGTTSFVDALSAQMGVNNGSSLVRMLLPAEIYTVEGKEMNAYVSNSIVFPQGYRLSNYDVDVTCAKGAQFAKYWRYTPVTGDGSTTATLSFALLYRGVQIASKSSTVKIAAASAGSGVTRKLLMIGDSTTASGEVTGELVNLFTSDAMHLTLIGTQGTGSNKHEGRGGWTVNDYATAGRTFYRFNLTGVTTAPGLGSVYSHNSSQYTVREVNMTGGTGYISCERTSGSTAALVSGTLTRLSGTGDTTLTFGSTSTVPGNPFWNAGTSLFDFSNYLTTNSFTMASGDWVFVHLGINDVFSITDDTALVSTITTMLSQLDTIITNIRTAVSGIRIGIFLTIPPASNQDAFGYNYGNGQTRHRYIENNSVLVNNLIAHFDTAGNKNNNIYVVPVHLNIDTENNFQTTSSNANARNTTQVTRQSNAVHPALSGYQQIADVVFATLKNFA